MAWIQRCCGRWHRPVATALIRPLAWESPYATGVALEKKRPKTKKQKKNCSFGVPIMVQWLANPTRNHEVLGSLPGLAQWVKDPVLQRAMV